mmetsp:Transcript_53224/g.137673  ORF Transcript_53224/g.137673 Transcript_53224/m.137673 type:complete len:322 (-) Transcript_53224:1584-2549(-)
MEIIRLHVHPVVSTGLGRRLQLVDLFLVDFAAKRDQRKIEARRLFQNPLRFGHCTNSAIGVRAIGERDHPPVFCPPLDLCTCRFHRIVKRGPPAGPQALHLAHDLGVAWISWIASSGKVQVNSDIVGKGNQPNVIVSLQRALGDVFDALDACGQTGSSTLSCQAGVRSRCFARIRARRHSHPMELHFALLLDADHKLLRHTRVATGPECVGPRRRTLPEAVLHRLGRMVASVVHVNVQFASATAVTMGVANGLPTWRGNVQIEVGRGIPHQGECEGAQLSTRPVEPSYHLPLVALVLIAEVNLIIILNLVHGEADVDHKHG